MQKNKNIIFGIRSVIEAIDAGKEIEKALVKRGSNSDLFRELIKKLRTANVIIQNVPVEKLNAVTRKNHQGVVAFLSEIAYSDISVIIPGIYETGSIPLILILDGISDVRNFGAIARTAECAGVQAIIIPKKGSAMINAEAVKASSGALHRINVCRYDRLTDAVRYLKNSGLEILASTEKATMPYYSAGMTGPVAMIMGSEDRGISDELLAMADVHITIPMYGSISSLNVSVATGILLFEASKQRSTSTKEGSGG